MRRARSLCGGGCSGDKALFKQQDVEAGELKRSEDTVFSGEEGVSGVSADGAVKS